jgi:hypothetical protein
MRYQQEAGQKYPFTISVSLEELASAFGTAKETPIRLLSELKDKKYYFF